MVETARGARGSARRGPLPAPSGHPADDGARVLVTGAGGKTGRAVLAALAQRRVGARAFVRSADRLADLRLGGGHRGDVEVAVGDQRDVEAAAGDQRDVEVAVGDQRDVDDLVAAMDGVDAVYAVAPNVSPHEVEMGRAAIAACRRAGVDRLVFHSVIHPQLTAMPHHADKARVEELVIGSGLAWTILQPNAYLQNLAGYADAIRAGRYEVPYATDRGSAMVHLDDVAEVAATALVDGVGVHGTFELSGPAEVSPDDVARVAADLLGHPVVAERQDPDAWAAANGQLPDGTRGRLLAMFRDYDAHGSPGDATVLAALLGRPPRDLRGYLADLLA